MIKITPAEQKEILSKYKNVFTIPTKYHIYCEERGDVLRFLRVFRRTH